MPSMRKIKQVIQPQVVIEGAGVRLRRSFGPNRENLFDPFLLFDHFAFNDPIEGPITGFPMHPHRGIETVTYMLEGSVHHRDSLGNAGLIRAGDVQWMTSGSGIMHEELPRRSPDGNVFGFQLWVNLPSHLKMSDPRYQEVSESEIPTVEKEGLRVRVVAGEFAGLQGPVTGIAASPVYLDVELEPLSSLEITIPPTHTAIAYVFKGKGIFGEGESVQAEKMVEFGSGEHLRAECGLDSGMRFMLMAGAPFGEPIAPYGPFVMNTQKEIRQAFEDLRSGTFVKVSA